jgi:hypothetical protein
MLVLAVESDFTKIRPQSAHPRKPLKTREKLVADARCPKIFVAQRRSLSASCARAGHCPLTMNAVWDSPHWSFNFQRAVLLTAGPGAGAISFLSVTTEWLPVKTLLSLNCQSDSKNPGLPP